MCEECGNDDTNCWCLDKHVRVAHLLTGMARMLARVTSCVGGIVRPVLLLLLLGHPLTGTLLYSGATILILLWYKYGTVVVLW